MLFAFEQRVDNIERPDRRENEKKGRGDSRRFKQTKAGVGRRLLII
jgi:hypothetical protein